MKWLLGTVAFFAAAAAVIACLVGQRLVLVAKGDLPVDKYPAPGPAPMAKMHAGERATVLSCDDLKSYSAIHVRLSDGTDGYVIDGPYALESASIWVRSNAGPIVFSCPKF